MKHKPKRLSAGMSLVETIVAMAIFAIMTLLVVTILSFAARQYSIAHEVDTNTDSEGAVIEQGGAVSQSASGEMFFSIGGKTFSVSGSRNTVGGNDDRVVMNYFIPGP